MKLETFNSNYKMNSLIIVYEANVVFLILIKHFFLSNDGIYSVTNEFISILFINKFKRLNSTFVPMKSCLLIHIKMFKININ